MSSPVRPSSTRSRHIPPPVFLVAAAVLQQLLARRAGPPPRWRRVASAALALVSLALPTTAALTFHSRRTTVSPLDPSAASALVTDGPNAFTRNPMYLGMAGLLTAHAWRRGSWLAVLPVAGFVAVIDRLQVPAEESALAERFGPAYVAYCARVPRWLPGVRRLASHGR
ncbi:isoprenylcysteine carboxylmethyltransferase family protein [Ruania alkalisoli]|uniref:Isoprenylcysteine carboxylmethyltransferase family protein n=1 Tax=Ruania alkalisoli TaxID=2779775 RepID=A0A7M1SQN4_9MICO|nr:isoprenylcysteine carboxylmethyltransferase family protein [Ruania alkalisoli]QOR69860.1 isoprenylcysteine carboxylmethyltransferase family protein [Ruania alkalisoli]